MDLPVRFRRWDVTAKDKVLQFRFYWGEVIMVWGLIRVALFSGSFLIGLTYWGPGRAPATTTKPGIERAPDKVIRGPLPESPKFAPKIVPNSGHSANCPRII